MNAKQTRIYQTRPAKRLDQAFALASEFKRLSTDGRHAEADGVRRTIDDLGVGSYIDGRWTLRADVLAAMGVER